MVKTRNKTKPLEKECPHCGKEFVSLYEKQLEYNFEQHIKSHERKENKNE